MVGIERITRMSRILKALCGVFILALPLVSTLPSAVAADALGTGSSTERALAPNASETGLGPAPFFVHFGPGTDFVASGVTTRRVTGQTEPFALTVPALPSGAVFVKSFLCWHYLLDGNAPQFDFITVQGNGLAGELKGTGTPDLCWSKAGSAVYLADASSAVIPGSNPFSVLIGQATDKALGTDPTAKGEGMSLVVVYESPGQSCRNAQLYCGYISTETGTTVGTAAATINFSAQWTSGAFHFFVNALDGQLGFATQGHDEFFVNGVNRGGQIAGTSMPNDAWAGLLGPRPNENYYDHANGDIALFLTNPTTSLSFSTVKIEDCIGHSFAAVSFASDTCYSTGDVDGDGILLTVADEVALIKFVNAGGPPPSPLFQGDLNGDGYIDQADIDLYECYFIYGRDACFPRFPIPVPCCPDTIRGACCEVDTCHIRSQVNCELRNGRYFGDGTACTDSLCWRGNVAGWKFKDLDGDGFQDAGEPPISGVTITSLPMVPGVPDPVVTDATGYWSFGPMPAGQYTIFETVPTGMVQTAPSTVYFTANVHPHMTALPGNFGNEDTCVTARQHVDTCMAGRNDNFDTSDGPELAAPDSELCMLLRSCAEGPRNTCDSTIPNNCSEFDCGTTNRCFGHTFTGCWDSSCTVIHARLCLRIRALMKSDPTQDVIQLMRDGVYVWSCYLRDLNGGHWNHGDELNTCLELDNLPLSPLGITNVLAALQDGDIDIRIQDDTEVDYLELIVTTCCHCIQPPVCLKAWWPLGEQAGATIVRDVVGGHNGTPSPGPIGPIAYANGPTPVSLWLPGVGGKVGDALYFWHQDQNRDVRVPGAAFQFGTADFSIDAWVFINQYSGTDIQPIVEKMQYNGTAPFRGYRLYLESGVLTFQVAGTSGMVTAQVGMPYQLSLGGWHHVAVTYHRPQNSDHFISLYIDGGLVITHNVSDMGYLTNNSDLIIGGSVLGPAINYLDIAIDELEIFGRSLDASEIYDLWKADNAGKCKPYCDCPHQGDMDASGFIDVTDVLSVIAVAFTNGGDIQDPACPTTRADVNNDGFVDVNDVIYMIKTSFVNGPYPNDPCQSYLKAGKCPQ